VRAVQCFQSTLITGGEDARLVVWGDADAIEEEMRSNSTAAGGAIKPSGMATSRHSPY
jgi:hypothetical protein